MLWLVHPKLKRGINNGVFALKWTFIARPCLRLKDPKMNGKPHFDFL